MDDCLTFCNFKTYHERQGWRLSIERKCLKNGDSIEGKTGREKRPTMAAQPTSSAHRLQATLFTGRRALLARHAGIARRPGQMTQPEATDLVAGLIVGKAGCWHWSAGMTGRSSEHRSRNQEGSDIALFRSAPDKTSFWPEVFAADGNHRSLDSKYKQSLLETFSKLPFFCLGTGAA